MSLLMTIILFISLAVILVGLVIYFRSVKRWPSLIFGIVGLLTVFIFMHFAFGFPQIIETKASEQETVLIIVCFIATLLGIIANYIYTVFEKEDQKPHIRLLIMPLCISPIIFFPLLQIIQETDLTTGIFSASKIALYIVAFQNGFLWRSVINRHKEKLVGQLPNNSQED